MQPLCSYIDSFVVPWSVVRLEIKQYPWVDEKIERRLRQAYEDGVTDRSVLISLLCLGRKRRQHEKNSQGTEQAEDPPLPSHSGQDCVNKSNIKILANFFAANSIRQKSKAAAWKYLWDGWKAAFYKNKRVDLVYTARDCHLSFVLGKDEYSHSLIDELAQDRLLNRFPETATESTWLNLICHLRTSCHQERVRKSLARTRELQSRTTHAVHWLWSGARSMEHGLSRSTDWVTESVLQPAGGWLCDHLEPYQAEEKDNVDQGQVGSQVGHVDGTPSKFLSPRDSLSPSAEAWINTTRAVQEASNSTRVTAERAVDKVRDVVRATAQSRQSKRTSFEEAKRKNPSPDKINSHEEVLHAVGHVGLAGIGAAAVVTDAMVEATKRLWTESSAVAAEVVEHKYGPTVGQVVRNSTDTVGNVGKTIACVKTVALIPGKASLATVVKEAGKAHLSVQRP